MDIARFLEANCLRVELRRVPQFADLRSCLIPGRILIIPYRIKDATNHYLIGVSVADHRKVILDVPHSVNPFDNLQPNWDDRSVDHIVLVVDPVDARSQSTSRLVVEPEVIDLGTISNADPICSTPVSKSFTLRNTSDKCLLVNEVQATCGCLRLDWTGGGLLAPHEERRVSFKVLLNTFPVGPTSRGITLVLPGANVKKVGIRVNMIAGYEEQQLIVTPDSLQRASPRPRVSM